MHSAYQDAYSQLPNIGANREILNMEPTSVQERLLQTLGNIKLLQQKEVIGDPMKLISQLKGSYSNTILLLRFMSYSMEKQLTENFVQFNILKVLAVWVQTQSNLAKKKDIKFCEEILSSPELNSLTFEQIIAYLNYISLDLISLLKSGTQQSRKKYTNNPNAHLDPADLINFLKFILPKTLMNVIVPRAFFPATLLQQQQQNIDMLYCNQILQHLTHTKPHYMVLAKNMMKSLLSMELEQSQIRQLILLSFKFYYLFHHDKNLGASQVVIESFKKMPSAVRFAINDEIALFLLHLKKIGRDLFVNYLLEKFQWVDDLVRNQKILGCPKSSLKPFPGTIKHSIKVEARKIQKRYLQIYDRFSLLYFNIHCIEYDVSIRFFYLGDFSPKSPNQPKLLFSGEKKENSFEGSIEVVERGIYMFVFDNSYSWMKSKTITYETAILVPLELREKYPCHQLKNIIFGDDSLNEVPSENIKGEVNDDEIKLDSASCNVSMREEDSMPVFRIVLLKNTGNLYEYETQNRERFIKKLNDLEGPQIHWLVEERKVNSLEDVKKWLRYGKRQKEEQFMMEQNEEEQINKEEKEVGEEKEKEESDNGEEKEQKSDENN